MVEEHGRLTAVAVMATLLLFLAPVISQYTDTLPSPAPNGAVMIRCLSEKPSVVGTGIIVGLSGRDVYIVTAKHLTDEGSCRATTVEVQLNARQTEWYPATIIERVAEGHDLAALRMTLPTGMSADQVRGLGSAPADSISRGSDVHAIGYSARRGWDANVAPDKVAAVGDDFITIQSRFVGKGFSGGPLFDACGRVIGMVTRVEPGEAKALPTALVVGVLNQWKLPTDLVSVHAMTCVSPAPIPSDRRTKPILYWTLGAESPRTASNGDASREVACPSGTGLVGLRASTAPAKMLNPDTGIDWIAGLTLACAPLRLEPVSSTRIELAADSLNISLRRLGSAGRSDVGYAQCPPNTVITAFEAESRPSRSGRAEYLTYFLARCGRLALVDADGEWQVKIDAAVGLKPLGKSHRGGRRTRFSCADRPGHDDGIITRVSATAGVPINGLAIGCMNAVVPGTSPTRKSATNPALTAAGRSTDLPVANDDILSTERVASEAEHVANRVERKAQRQVMRSEPDRWSPCRKRMNPIEAVLTGGYERAGLVYLRVALDADVEPLQKRAFNAAMDMWNRHSRTTGFVFEETPPNTADLRFRRGTPVFLRGSEVNASCAAYQPDNTIWYSPENMKWLEHDKDVALAARIYAHELGHALNLDHKPGDNTSLMRDFDELIPCKDAAQFLPDSVSTKDRADALFCGNEIREEVRTRRLTLRP